MDRTNNLYVPNSLAHTESGSLTTNQLTIYKKDGWFIHKVLGYNLYLILSPSYMVMGCHIRLATIILAYKRSQAVSVFSVFIIPKSSRIPYRETCSWHQCCISVQLYHIISPNTVRWDELKGQWSYNLIKCVRTHEANLDDHSVMDITRTSVDNTAMYVRIIIHQCSPK